MSSTPYSLRHALVAALALLMSACGSDTGSAGGDATAGEPGIHVVASTTWTGALAKLAGASDVDVIAPTSVLHPPDYDPKPSDLVAAAEADVVVYAEFESFATRLLDAAGGEATVVSLVLENTPSSIESEVLRLAAAMGTEDVARANLDAFLPAVAELGDDAATHVTDPPPVVVSQLFVAYWADWAGLTAVGTFGPAPMTAGALSDLAGLTPTFVLDNHHMPGGQAFEAEGTPRIELINYPGDDLDLLAVFQRNHDLVVQALDGEIVADPTAAGTEGDHTDHDHGTDTTGHDH